MASAGFGLILRAGIIPLEAVKDAGYRVGVARHRVSPHYVQAAFTGGGIEYAERLIKQPGGSIWSLPEGTELSGGDFSGLECRWDAVPSPHGETISLIVKAAGEEEESQARFYNEVIEAVRDIYGDDDQCRPVRLSGLHTTYSINKLSVETTVRSFARGRLAWIRHLTTILLQNVIGWVLMRFRLTVDGVPWGDYKSDLILNLDFKKFDGVLREVISGTPAQRESLRSWLEERRERGECIYGIHASPSALITCLISKRAGDHFHFVDGSDGGYAMAASEMKAQIATANKSDL